MDVRRALRSTLLVFNFVKAPSTEAAYCRLQNRLHLCAKTISGSR